ncbi:hypothetical protein IU500_12540 [Nocardia terpenica]|uniref:DUF6879 family protein n=1 Tax=Nocardia terpenica TaxID=455432 RepID=UPI001893D491|nr:DUF6879 family protein [Nocardia terpenica]MBF6062994.1 hypothetical protein [Nocardia terpenica]MBF6104871.1 hypothetical protein [Nocardia terpenica]MBF6112692.1 hypothetical protein [Nocardia terpenica]MBF6118599.1 hypothetical protein [Nocardia terpenica]MBF6155078.1 hypothetical protein [Nocardia terpenica]
MVLLTDEQWAELHASCTTSALHLELRDVYVVPDEAERFAKWRTGQLTEAEEVEWWAPWQEMTRRQVARGVTMRRARIVSEPASSYIHFEWATTRNVEGGEDVRWLPRHRATGLEVVPVDFWLFDDRKVVFNHFSGSGEWIGNEVTEDPTTVRRCRSSFEAVWQVATPHADYKPALG